MYSYFKRIFLNLKNLFFPHKHTWKKIGLGKRICTKCETEQWLMRNLYNSYDYDDRPTLYWRTVKSPSLDGLNKYYRKKTIKRKLNDG